MRKNLSEALDDVEKRKKVGKTLVIVGTTMIVGSLYAKHRKVVNAAISVQQDLAFESMWTSFDQGVRYGLQLAKVAAETGKDALEVAKEAGDTIGAEYGFGAFDKNSLAYAFRPFDRPA